MTTTFHSETLKSSYLLLEYSVSTGAIANYCYVKIKKSNEGRVPQETSQLYDFYGPSTSLGTRKLKTTEFTVLSSGAGAIWLPLLYLLLWLLLLLLLKATAFYERFFIL